MDFIHHDTITKFLNQKFDCEVKIISVEPLYGGSINEVLHLKLESNSIASGINTYKSPYLPNEIVVKTNTNRPSGFFEKEFEGLKQLSETIKKNSIEIRTPHPIAALNLSTPHPIQLLIMEYIPQSKKRLDQTSWKNFGYHLAKLHIESYKVRSSTNKKYGWHENTFIGNNIQYNTLEEDWIVFFRKHRLIPQRDWGIRNHYLSTETIRKLDFLIDHLDKYIPRNPPASLLHGDLWTGNFFFSDKGEPVIIDPSVYYGHGETDLAMTELFGSFPHAFYSGYHSLVSQDQGTEIRKTVYNLYHLINHLNLFGTSYLSSVKSSINSILKH